MADFNEFVDHGGGEEEAAEPIEKEEVKQEEDSDESSSDQSEEEEGAEEAKTEDVEDESDGEEEEEVEVTPEGGYPDNFTYGVLGEIFDPQEAPPAPAPQQAPQTQAPPAAPQKQYSPPTNEEWLDNPEAASAKRDAYIDQRFAELESQNQQYRDAMNRGREMTSQKRNQNMQNAGGFLDKKLGKAYNEEWLKDPVFRTNKEVKEQAEKNLTKRIYQAGMLAKQGDDSGLRELAMDRAPGRGTVMDHCLAQAKADFRISDPQPALRAPSGEARPGAAAKTKTHGLTKMDKKIADSENMSYKEYAAIKKRRDASPW